MYQIDVTAQRGSEKFNILLQEDGTIAAPNDHRGKNLYELLDKGYTLIPMTPGQRSTGRLGTR
jgi:hypothetical protein